MLHFCEARRREGLRPLVKENVIPFFKDIAIVLVEEHQSFFLRFPNSGVHSVDEVRNLLFACTDFAKVTDKDS